MKNLLNLQHSHIAVIQIYVHSLSHWSTANKPLELQREGCTQPHSNHFPPLAVTMKADTAACDIIVEVTLRMLLLSRFAAVFVASHKNTVTELNMQGGGDASA